MEDIQKTIQASIAEALAGLGTGDIAASRDGTDPLISSATLTSRLDMPQHVLSRWPWVPEDTIKSIAIGNFEIDNLPKLHRSDDLRNAYLKRSMKGIYQPLDGGPPEIIVGTSKLHASFSSPTTFFLAWHIYVSIRAEFKPEMGTRLAYWTERLQYFVQLSYPWYALLEYIIAYYQKYQNRTDPEAWFEPDSTLIHYHISLVQQKSGTAQLAPPVPGGTASSSTRTPQSLRARPTGQKLEMMANDICMMFNQPAGCRWKDREGGSCPRRHICIRCTSPHHSATACPVHPDKAKPQK